MKNIKPRYYIYSILLVLAIINLVGLLLLWNRLRSLDTSIDTLSSNQSASQGSAYNDATIAPSERLVYLPLAKLKLVDSSLNEGLVYMYTDQYTLPGNKKLFPASLSISTHDLVANAGSTTQQFDCTEVVYADFTTPSYPVNPMWKLDGSTKLTDGRTMNVYYAPSIPGCEVAWQLNKIDSKAIADSLMEAASY